MQTLVFWVLLLTFVGAFVLQVATRVRLIASAPGQFDIVEPLGHLRRFLLDVLLASANIHGPFDVLISSLLAGLFTGLFLERLLEA